MTAPAFTGWQPIETAPRDCVTECIFWCQGEVDGWVLFGVLVPGEPQWLSRQSYDATDYWPHENGGYLTHWMPLPAAPTDHPTQIGEKA